MAAVETGRHHTSYRSELRLWHTRPQIVRMAVLAAVVIILPLILDNYWMSLANTALIAAIGAIGLNILVGYTGQISLGQGGFLAVGAFTSAILTDRLGMPAPLSILGAVMLTAAIGVIVGLPALRLKGSTSRSPPSHPRWSSSSSSAGGSSSQRARASSTSHDWRCSASAWTVRTSSSSGT